MINIVDKYEDETTTVADNSINESTETTKQETVNVLKKKRPAFAVLSPEALAIVKEKCREAQKNGQFNIIPSDQELIQAFEKIRADYLNTDLPLLERSVKNITITPDEFRQYAKVITDKIIQLLCKEYDKKNIIPVYIWRAGVFPFMESCIDAGMTQHTHIGLARNEETLEPIQYLPITLDISKITKDCKILLADPMLATG